MEIFTGAILKVYIETPGGATRGQLVKSGLYWRTSVDEIWKKDHPKKFFFEKFNY